MNLKIDINAALFNRLSDETPEWWKNLIADTDVYIDIRKNNYINVYVNGGSIMNLKGSKEYKAKIHFEYIPLKKAGDYLPFDFEEGHISIPDIDSIPLNNFDAVSLKKIKTRIKKFYPNSSEKGIQGKYVTDNNRKTKSNGFFIDTEFQYTLNKDQDDKSGRVDLVWVDLKRKEIVLVELKTMGDARLFDKNCTDPESIDIQLKKYAEFAKKNEKMMIDYYDKVFQIKNKLKILPSFATETSLSKYNLVKKPILIIGDCTQNWIDTNAEGLNSKIKNIAHSCIYQGIKTSTFKIPEKSVGNIYTF